MSIDQEAKLLAYEIGILELRVQQGDMWLKPLLYKKMIRLDFLLGL